MKVLKNLAIVLVLAATGNAHAEKYYIDRFTATSGGSAILDDNFDNGIPPAPGVEGYVGVDGSFPLGSEAGGKLELDAASNGATFFVGPEVYKDLDAGVILDRNSAFSVSGLFDLIAPQPIKFSNYGMFVVDVGIDSGTGAFFQNSLSITVQTRSDGVSEVNFEKIDFLSGTFESLATLDISTGGHSGIALTLSNDAGSNLLNASYQYYDGSAAFGSATTIGSPYALEGFYSIGGFVATSLPVPEPETWALMMSGLGMLSMVARRKRRTASA